MATRETSALGLLIVSRTLVVPNGWQKDLEHEYDFEHGQEHEHHVIKATEVSDLSIFYLT
jgi:hypothetical protein